MKEYVYTISCPLSLMVVYVGKTINPENRKKTHFRNYSRNSCIGYWCKAMISIGHEPIFKVVSECETNRAYSRSYEEQEIIEKYKQLGQAFFNYPSNKRNFKPFDIVLRKYRFFNNC